MNPILRKILGLKQSPTDLILENKESDKPYILSSIFYLSIFIIIGLPMWFYTCSITRYSLSNLANLEHKLEFEHDFHPKLHLDISVIQLSRHGKSDIDDSNNQQTTYLRTNLPKQLDTAFSNLTYNINWRVRGPTVDENKIFQHHQKEYAASNNNTRAGLLDLEAKLLAVHKPSNRFRLFLYLIEEQFYSAYCEVSRSHTYTLSFERFAYLCPSDAMTTADNHAPVVTLIENVIEEIYSESINHLKAKLVIEGKSDLLFSLLPESTSLESFQSLTELADKIHKIFHKNVRIMFPELKELVNIRPITQNVVDLLDDKMMEKLTKKLTKVDPDTSSTNSTKSSGMRIIQLDKIGELFQTFESRLSKHSAKTVQNILTLYPDQDKSPIIFKFKPVEKVADSVNILEVQDQNSMLIAGNDRSLVLSLRALIRRLVGLTSVNISKNCNVRRDIFFNRWEIDSLMGMFTIIKLQRTLASLRSINNQVSGIKIPKDVASMANEAYELTFKSVQHLETKQTLEAYRSISRAHELAETAYYDPSLLESLYFPDELKYAIYAPLFLPLALPMLSSTLNIIKYAWKLFRSPQKSKTD